MNKLILVGGMAIDIALRSVGSFLYPDDKLPDYDFYSPKFHIDAYTIGELLVDVNGKISVIRATHISTMRVRVNFVPVADITYIPQIIYDKIPTIEHMGFTIVHPHYQMIDQHRSLSLPYENAPMETIMHRWEKDMKRYTMLNESFPIENHKYSKNELKKYNLKFKHPVCITGYAALLYWVSKARSLGFEAKLDGVINEQTAEIPDVLELLADVNLEIDGQALQYNATLDKIPSYILYNDTHIVYDNKNRLTSAKKINDDLYVANLQTIMCLTLAKGIIYRDTNALSLYSIAQSLLFWACVNIEAGKDFLPTVEVFGCCNVSESYIIAREEELSGKRSSELGKIPRDAYPDVDKKIGMDLYEFDPAKSPVYQFDGTAIQITDQSTAAADSSDSSDSSSETSDA